MNFNEKLISLRKSKGLSQEELGAELNVTRQTISKWESGQGKPEIDNVIKMTEIYNVSSDYILLGTEHKTITPMPEKKNLSKEYRRAIGIIAIVGATAIITVLFITALWVLAKFVF